MSDAETFLMLKYGHKEFAVEAWHHRSSCDTVWDDAEMEVIYSWQKEWAVQDYWPTKSRYLQDLYLTRKHDRQNTIAQ